MKAEKTKLQEFTESYYISPDAELEALRLDNEKDGIPLIMKETENMLRVLLETSKPKDILEIGTAYAYSAIFFAKTCPDATVTTIEKDENMHLMAASYIEKCDTRSRIELICGDACDVMREMQGRRQFDFVFIDAGKTHYREYFDIAESLCRPGAMIVCDNILIRGLMYDDSLPGYKKHLTSVRKMKDFLSYIKSRDDITASISGGGDGLAIIRLNG